MKRHVDCKQLREQFLKAVSAPAKLPAEAAEHLRQCPACASEWDSLRKTWVLLGEWEAPAPSPYFDTRLQARLREEKAAPLKLGVLSWLRSRWQPVLATALSLGLVAGLTIFRTPAPPATPPANASAAVSDLQDLDKNADVYDSDLLYGDDQQAQRDQQQ
jgi:hypothetical protein